MPRENLGVNESEKLETACAAVGFLGAIGSQGIREMQKVTKSQGTCSQHTEVLQTHTDARP